MKFNSTFTKLITAYRDPSVNIIVLYGGKSSGKTYSVLQLLHQVALYSAAPKLISITSETLPHLRKGAIKDYIDILKDEGMYSKEMHNKSEYFFSIGKSKIEYFPADIGRSKGPRRHILYMNEAINCHFEAWDNLMTRTHEKKIIDFNPAWEFWAHEHLQGREDVAWIHSTFLNNEYITDGELQEILRRKNDPKYKNWWRVYGEGLLGQIEGLVYQDWQIVPGIPEGATLLGYGLDFGFTNDPTALIAVYKYQSEVYIDELIYMSGLTTPDTIRLMNNQDVNKKMPIFADNSEPRFIREIELAGFNIKGQKKENVADSVEFARKYLKFVTANSLNTIKELRSYMYMEKNGKFINIPVDAFNHAMDSMRYAFLGLFGTEYKNVIKGYRVLKRRCE